MADTLMRPDQIKILSPEGRVKNSYEALYYNVKSGDPEADKIVRDEIQRAFQRHDVLLAENPDTGRLRDVMLDAYSEAARELGGEDLYTIQKQRITKDFDTFTSNHPSFYESSFKSYERKYGGETVDFSADYNRVLQEDPNLFAVPSEDDLDRMEQAYYGEPVSEPQPKPVTQSGLSYAGRVPEAQAQTARRSYQQIRKEEAAAKELKGDKYDKGYDQYKRNRQDDYQKTTAGDDYGFDEHEYVSEAEDDGPEL